jgi:hypothetical protein
MSTITIITGSEQPISRTWIAPNNDDWSDVVTWAAFTRWNNNPGNLVLRVDDDLLTTDVRCPTLDIAYQGSLSLTLKISDTGTFTGEETTYTFTLGTAVTVIAGRYYRWTVTVAPSGTTVPEIALVSADYSQIFTTEIYKSVSTSTLAGTVSARTVPLVMGTVLAVQLTPHGDFTWVDRAYALPDAWSETTIAPKASIISKSPLTICLRDDFGVAVDGTVDIQVVGIGKIVLTDNGVKQL